MIESTKELIGVFDNSFNLLLEGSVITGLNVSEDAKIFTHPLEDGTSIADHKIRTPIEINMAMVLPRDSYLDLYAKLRVMFQGDATFTVQTRSATYKGMALQKMPHDESADMMDVLPMALTFVQAKFVTTQFQALPASKAKNKRDQSTIKRGQQQEGKKKSAAATLTDNGRDWIKGKLGK